MKAQFKLLIFLVLSSTHAWAGSQYAIQLEASKSPDLAVYQSLSVHGNLYTVAAGNGYIRARLGPYSHKNTALNVLEQVHAAGFTDAFLAKETASNLSSSPSGSYSSNHSNLDGNLDLSSVKEWNMLTPEQQANVVFLDGKLYVKNGDIFTPLEVIVRQQ